MTSEERLRAERDLYRGLLELGAADDPRPLLEEALRRLVAATRARQGYVAIYAGGDLASEPVSWLAHACSADDVAELRTRLSRGIVREAVERGQTISTASAIEDPRFMQLPSVSIRGIRAVLCAPLGDAGLGVLYLQGREPAGPFDEEDRRLVEAVAREIAPYAERLVARVETADPTAPWRAQLPALGAIAGRSPALAGVLRQMALVAPLDVTVLFTGPSGVGKTTFARALHASGPRATGPFVELSCAALPDALVESELFGAERGAHSTADRAMPGKVEAAEGGTLFLDEIGELPLASQAKLLSLLQSRTYYRLGGTAPREADVRVIAATNVDLEAAARDKTFREDLYYRLAVVPIAVPPLSSRREDVVPIAERVLADVVRRHRLPSLPLAPGARAALEASEWPGNVRQLANALEAALIRAAGEGAAQIARRHLSPARDDGEDARADESFHAATRDFQRRLLARALDAEGWNVTAVARRLDLSRSRLNELIRELGLTRPGT
ncbi:MAG: sigma-54-dependent Fis family transcriptional regulator [Sandaracinaceae bacterium]|nr:sigma-54-dependent Fis family transcriptional regulator [Sandaracinaceae bacterium]